jgi:hypothetical protein
MEIRFIPNEDDVRGLCRVRSSSSGWNTLLFTLLLALLFVVGWHLIERGFAVAGWIWLSLSVALGVALYEVPRSRVRREFHRTPAAQGEFVFAVDDHGITATFPAGSSRMDWHGFLKYQETTSFFLMFHSPSRYWWIPKRAMSTEEAIDLGRALKARIPPYHATGK